MLCPDALPIPLTLAKLSSSELLPGCCVCLACLACNSDWGPKSCATALSSRPQARLPKRTCLAAHLPACLVREGTRACAVRGIVRDKRSRNQRQTRTTTCPPTRPPARSPARPPTHPPTHPQICRKARACGCTYACACTHARFPNCSQADVFAF